MKKILGLDLGTTSIGWAYVIEDDNYEKSEIKQIGVRVNPLTVDEQTNFEKGRPFSVNAERTLKRGARRNLDRYKDRRENLNKILKKHNILNESTILTEDGKNTTHSTWAIRSKATTERIELDEFARVLLAINKKRGYKSNRKAKDDDEGQAIDGMAIAKKLYEENLTPGQYVFQLLKEGKKAVPDFYRSDLQAEFDRVWQKQKQYYPDVFTDTFYEEVKGKGQRATAAIFWNRYGFNTADIKDLEDSLKTEKTIKLNLTERKRLQAYKWRNDAINLQLAKEEAAYVIAEINKNLSSSSGYLGSISDRSKELYFNKQTVGQYLYKQLQENRHTRLKNQVFYRQDYLDEFEKIWETQAKYHTVLTPELKSEIRDTIIFYQRRLKSQKELISFCEFESKVIEVEKDGKKTTKTIGARVAPRSSPLFQEFKIWQILNNMVVKKKGSKKRKPVGDVKQTTLFEQEKEIFSLNLEEKQLLFDELNIKGTLKDDAILEMLGCNTKEWEMNYKSIDGNRTNRALYDAYLKIIELSGHDVRDYLRVKTSKDEIELDDLKVPASQIKEMVVAVFETLGIDTSILDFNAELEGKAFEQQPFYQLWHLLYSYEGDNSKSGNERLYKLLEEKFGFSEEYGRILANVPLLDDYGNLSTKAIRRILPYIKEHQYDEACSLAGYRHSKHSFTKDELENRILKRRLELLKKNSLRQPVVEKVLNQMVNVVNTLIDIENKKLKAKGKPEDFHFDEIRIELARELKNSAEKRKQITEGINKAKGQHEQIAKLLQNEFGIKNPTRNDIIRYKLYEELKDNGYKDLYTNTYIPREKLYSKEIDIEHIIPQSRLFDDSFSNKTVVYRDENLKKGNRTAYDYILEDYGEGKLDEFVVRIEKLFQLGQKSKEGGLSKAKYRKLLKSESEIEDGLIERDLRETQYIAKKAKEMLFTITRRVVTTTGQVTDKLREDWGLINVMKELNLPKYRALGLTEMEERKYGQQVEVIKDWTKRNDHRHHAMDALTVAFTKHSHIQYLNYLNARNNPTHKLHGNIIAIEKKELEEHVNKNGTKTRLFKEPMPNFRLEAKKHLENVIISHKSKNKVVTKNKNRISGKSQPQITLTPRGQLHKETVYGLYHYYETKMEKVGTKFDLETIAKVANPVYRNALLQRLAEYNNDPKKAFGGANSPSKKPIYTDETQTKKVPEQVKLSCSATDYSVRKDVTPENFKEDKDIDKVLDKGIVKLLRERLQEFGGDAKKAFSDLDLNPIWQNKEKGIAIKRVTISGVKNAEPLHYKKDHHGKLILDKHGNPIPVDFVSTGNNHHVAIYRDEQGALQEKVVSFFEAVTRVNQGLPIIDKGYNSYLGWKFLFTMKQNELF
ncbi:MAG: type II CRISPR RNA-guided endonuclease Cas9, partial [Rikenellaceae bacterium]|nr:type II CRISPR RNA-guided endonuclease Cas9 [Rikenellaceae bacterium]